MINTYIQFLPVTLCLFWSFLLLLRHKSNLQSHNILALLFLIRGISFFAISSQISGKINSFEYVVFDIIDTFFTPLFYPLVYIYFRAITVGGGWKSRDLIFFLPGLMLGLFNFLIYLLIGPTTACLFVETDFGNIVNKVMSAPDKEIYGLHYLVSVVFYHVLIISEIIIVSVYALVSTYNYHKRVKEFYSNLEDKFIQIDKRIIVWTLIGVLTSLVFMFTGRAFWIKNTEITTLFYILWAVTYFSWGLMGYRKQYTVDNLNADIMKSDLLEAEEENALQAVDTEIEPTENKEEDEVNTDKHARLHALFIKLINEDHIYCKSDLRIDTLARSMYTNRLYVSQMIRENYGFTFSNYINHKRIEYAIELLNDMPDIKLDELADKTGFVSAQSLSRTFKQIKGLPPKEWIRKHRV